MESPSFFGWRVIAAAFVAQFLVNGSTFAVYGVFVVPLSEEFGIQPGRFGLGMAISFLGMGLMGPLIGRWLDRGYARTVMMAGVLISGVGLLLLSQAQSFWQLAAVFCTLVALGAALYGPTASTTLVASWFERRRGLALGVAVAGATVAGPVATVAAAHLIDDVGWRATLLILGGVVLVIGLPVFWWNIVARPELLGQHMDGEEHEPEAVPPSVEIETRELVRDRRLWLLALGFAFIFSSPIVLMLTLVPFGEELGFSRKAASYFFIGMAPFSIFGKILFGAVADRVPILPAIWLVTAGNAVVWGLLGMDPGYPVFLAIGALYGLAIGAAGPLQGVALGLCFGREGFGRASGIGGLAALPLIAAAPAVAGALRDATGSYHTGFQLQLVLLLIGGILLSLVSFPRPTREIAA